MYYTSEFPDTLAIFRYMRAVVMTCASTPLVDDVDWQQSKVADICQSRPKRRGFSLNKYNTDIKSNRNDEETESR